MRNCRLLLACLLLISLRGAAQVDEPLFHRITLEQGLSDGRVSSIVQDKYGFMWFGTANGLNRYDGYNIKVYEAGESGLANNNISTLFCSRAGTLYVGDGDGILTYNYTTDRFARPPGTDSSEINTKGNYVALIAEDDDARIYLGCTEGFFRYDPRRAIIEDMNVLLHSDRKIRHVSGLSFGKDGRIWITTQKQGVFVVDPVSNTFTEIPHDKQYGPGECCFAIHRTVFLDDHRLLMGQHSFGLTVLDTRTRQFSAQPGSLGKNDSVRFNAVYRLIKDHKGRIWGGTAYHGLIQYLPDTRAVIQYKHDPFNPFSYGGYRIFALYEDREHNIWIGTGGYGVYRFHPDKSAVRYYPWNPLGRRSPPGAEVLSAGVRDSNTAWIGTDKGPAIFDFRSGSFRPYRFENSYSHRLPGSNINYIYTDRTGLVWMGSRSLGLSRFDEQSQQFYRYFHPETDIIGRKPIPESESPLPANTVLSIAEDDEGNLVLLLGGRWLAFFNPSTGKSRYYKTDSNDALLRLRDVSHVMRYGNQILIGQHDRKGARVLRYSLPTRQVSTFIVIDTTGKTRINSIHTLPDSSIALATSNGIYIINEDGGIRQHYLWQGDAIHNNILSIITGIPGAIWACTDRHIGRVDLKSGAWLWLGSGEGLKPTRFFGDAFKLLPGNRIIAGNGDGLFIIYPSDIQNSPPRPPVLVDFQVSGRAFPLPDPLQDVREIRLTHQQNFFSFGMSSLQFNEGSNTEYSYKLEGFDRDWQPAGSDRTGQYTGVRGGSYVLRLRARAGTADWVESPQNIQIIIDKPWWNTWAFRLLLLLILLGIIAVIYLNRVRGIRKEERMRTDYEIRLNELEISALRTQMNPHFIFNCLNTINSYINSNQKSQANHYITRFAKLIRLILENSRQRRVPLSKELEALQLYLQLEALRFEHRFSWVIDVDEALDTDNVEVPPLVLQPFVENAILHGILPRSEAGFISVRIRQQGSLVAYVVEDDGIGRDAARKRSAEGALQKESHGMAITTKRIELFNREHHVQAIVEIEDLYTDGIATGTRVLIPLALVEGF